MGTFAVRYKYSVCCLLGVVDSIESLYFFRYPLFFSAHLVGFWVFMGSGVWGSFLILSCQNTLACFCFFSIYIYLYLVFFYADTEWVERGRDGNPKDGRYTLGRAMGTYLGNIRYFTEYRYGIVMHLNGVDQ